MKDDKFKIVVIAKKFSFNLNSVLCRFPNNEKVLKDKIKSLIYEIIEYIYEANYMPLDKYREERIKYQIKILAKVSMIDCLLEEAYRKGYITETIFHEKVKELNELSMRIKGWISYEKNNSERSS